MISVYLLPNCSLLVQHLSAFFQCPSEPKHVYGSGNEADVGSKDDCDEGHLRVELPPPTDKLPARIGYALPVPNSQA